MKRQAQSVNRSQEKKGIAQQDSTVRDAMAATVPPSYGIDFVDRQLRAEIPRPRAETAVVQCRRLRPPSIEDRGGPAVPGGHRIAMPDPLRFGIEALSGVDMSSVRIHAGSAKPARLNALAYAQGSDIYLGPGHEKHLPHEAWHVVQQRQARVKPTMSAKGIPINADSGLEREAEEMGARASRLSQPYRVAASPARKVAEGSNARDSDSGPQVVQRLVGFEIETGIPITKTRRGTAPSGSGVRPLIHKDPTHELSVDTTLLGEIHADHVSGHTQSATEAFGDWPIVEFVTHPLKETTPVDEFENTAKAWLTLLKTLRDKVDSTPPTESLKDTVAASPKNIHIGFPGTDKGMGEGGVNRISVQMTIGARLDRLEELRKSISKANIAGPMVSPAWAFGATSNKNLSAVMPLIEAKVGSPHKPGLFPSKLEKARSAQTQRDDVTELSALLHLVCNYLVAGVETKKGYVKNRTFVFYKSQLSDVVEALVSTNLYAEAVLRGKNAKWVKDQILHVNGRSSDEGVFPNFKGAENNGVYMPTCGEWLDEIFAGSADRVFNFARNPWSDKLGPDTVGGKLAAVVELRSPSSLDPGATKAFNLGAGIDDVVAHLKALYLLQQAWQDVKVAEK